MEYKMVRCADVLDVRDGTHDSPKYVLEGYPLITSKNIKEGNIEFDNVNYITKDEFDKINARSKVDDGDILMPMIGTIGNPVIVNTEMPFAIKNVALFKFRGNSNFDNRYVYYALKSPIVINQLNSNKRGGTQSFVSLGNIRDLKIPNITIDTQKKIVTILDKAQSLIDKRKEQIEACDELVKSRFIQMFGDVKLNPFNWDVSRLEEVYEIIDGDRGKDYPKQEDFSDEGYCLFLNAGNVTANGFSFKNNAFITKEKDEILRKGKLNRYDLIVTTRGTVGNVAYYNEDVPYENMRINSGMVILRKRKKINSIFFMQYFRNPTVYQSLISGSAQPQMPISSMRNAKVFNPPIELQNQFSEFVKQVNKLKFEMEQSLKELENNFNSLMQRAFKGELF
ncbi:restriction endonuclease subunit S [Clostridium sp. UBA7339]|uniref:restriction endonuclease subunit S n=1 Tax=Clostridium sp. UBA7339 TaxID=1946376 RepID=UPI00321805AA